MRLAFALLYAQAGFSINRNFLPEKHYYLITLPSVKTELEFDAKCDASDTVGHVNVFNESI